MPPKIPDPVSWQQAELLMQPAFIRTLDRIRQQLEVSNWKGTYQNKLIWPAGTTAETQAIVTQYLQQLETASADEIAAIEQILSKLPTPQPKYLLCLQRENLPEVNVDLWEICYQICFRNYSPSLAALGNFAVEIDTSLIDETGDVDWQRLDAKAAAIVERIFANLPND